jgi:hypothetical protein
VTAITEAHGSLAAWAPLTDTRTWRDDAACKGQTGLYADEECWPLARRICLRCPVRDECLDDALETGDASGWYRAACTPAQLREVARVVLRRGVPRLCEVCGFPFRAEPRRRFCGGCR